MPATPTDEAAMAEATAGAADPASAWLRWAPWIIFAVALAVRLLHASQSLWADELYTLRLAQRPVADIVAHADQTPPLHALLLHFWIQVAGTSELALRAPSVLAGAAGAGLAVVVARRYTWGAGPLLAGLLVALHPVLVGQAVEARAYALLLLLGTLSWWLWLRLGDALKSTADGVSDGVPWRLGIAYATVTAAALYTHVFAGFFVLAQVGVGLATTPPRTWLRLAGWPALALLAFAPWLGMLLQRVSYITGGFWIHPSDVWSFRSTALFWLGTLAFAPHLIAWLRGLWARPKLPKNAWPTLVAWAAVPAAVPWLISFWIPIYIPRYAMPAAVGLLILLAAVVWSLPKRSRVTLAVLLVVGGVGASAVLGSMDGEIGRQDWRNAVAHIEAKAGPGDAVLVLPAYCDSRSDEPIATYSCPWGHYGDRTDLDLVPAGTPNVGLVEGSKASAMNRLANATSVWLMDATVRPPAPWLEPLGEQGVEVRMWFGEGWHQVSDSHFARLHVVHYVRE